MNNDDNCNILEYWSTLLTLVEPILKNETEKTNSQFNVKD